MVSNLDDLLEGLKRGDSPVQLMDVISSLDLDSILRIWREASALAQDPTSPMEVVMSANRLRVHIQQQRPDIKYKLPGTFL